MWLEGQRSDKHPRAWPRLPCRHCSHRPSDTLSPSAVPSSAVHIFLMERKEPGHLMWVLVKKDVPQTLCGGGMGGGISERLQHPVTQLKTGILSLRHEQVLAYRHTPDIFIRSHLLHLDPGPALGSRCLRSFIKDLLRCLFRPGLHSGSGQG